MFKTTKKDAQNKYNIDRINVTHSELCFYTFILLFTYQKLTKHLK